MHRLDSSTLLRLGDADLLTGASESAILLMRYGARLRTFGVQIMVTLNSDYSALCR